MTAGGAGPAGLTDLGYPSSAEMGLRPAASRTPLKVAVGEDLPIAELAEDRRTYACPTRLLRAEV